MPVLVQSRERKRRAKVSKVRQWAKRVLGELGLDEKELSILLVDDEEIHRLNLKYLGRDRPTNVMAFPMDGPEGRLLGDVVISTETAEREAGERGVPLEEHLALLLVHGILHLLGYDHEKGVEEEKMMREKEEELLASLGL